MRGTIKAGQNEERGAVIYPVMVLGSLHPLLHFLCPYFFGHKKGERSFHLFYVGQSGKLT